MDRSCLQYTMTDLILRGKRLPNQGLKFGEVDSTRHRKALVISLWLSQVCTHMLSIACIQNTKTAYEYEIQKITLINKNIKMCLTSCWRCSSVGKALSV